MNTNTPSELTLFSHNRLSVYNLCEEFSYLNGEANSEPGARYLDAIQVPVTNGECWLFDYGVVVFWAVEEDERQAILNRLANNTQIDTLLGKIEEHFHFQFTDHLKISRDIISLPSQTPLMRLALSHALAQSIKLLEFEMKAQKTINDHNHIPNELVKTGKISLNRKKIAQIRGVLFSTKSDIILHYGLLDTPEFIWEYPEFEDIYNTAARYMEIHQRVDLLSKKLSTIHELFEMLADEQKHHHSSFLEWIIIILIAIEIVIYFIEEFAKAVH